jgi:hypothetical protein
MFGPNGKYLINFYQVNGNMENWMGKDNLSLQMDGNMRETLETGFLMELVFTPIQKTAELPTLKAFGRTAKNQARENLFIKVQQNMRETLKMTKEMGTVYSHFQKKVQKSTMLDIGLMMNKTCLGRFQDCGRGKN